MAAPRIPRSRVMASRDYSPREVAELDLLRLKKSAIYNWIKRGDILVFYDSYGHERISELEIRRLQEQWKLLPDSMTREEWREQSMRRERARMAAYENLAQHGKEAVAKPMREGLLRSLERKVDPEGVLPPEERTERAIILRKAQLSRARLKRQEKDQLREQYGKGDKS